MMRQALRIVGMGFIAGTLCLPARAGTDPFQWAIGIAENFMPSRSSRSPSSGDGNEAEYARTRKAVEEFSKQSATLTPEDAARQWLALFDRCAALPEGFRRISSAPVYGAGPFNVLPGPATWPILQKLVEARAGAPKANAKAEAILLFVVHTLNNEESNQWADLTAMSSPTGVLAPSTSATVALGKALSLVAGQPADVEAFWKRLLKSLETYQPEPEVDSVLSLQLPDFVTLLGEAKAEPLLLQALTLSKVKVSSVFGESTKSLARKVALSHLSELKQAPWTLTESLNGSKLYEALVVRFPNPDSNQSLGEMYHAVSLAVEGKIEQAVPAMSNLESSSITYAVSQAADAGYAEQMYTFLKAYLAEHPQNESWSIFITIAAKTGHGEEALKFVEEILARKDLPDEARTLVHPIYYRALLAVDQVNPGIEQLRTLIKKSKATLATLPKIARPDSGEDQSTRELTRKIIAWDIELAKLGVLLKREELVTEGVDDARLRSPQDDLITFFLTTGRTEEAAKLLLTKIKAVVAEKAREAADDPQGHRLELADSEIRGHLVELTTAYYNAGQWEKILSLLAESTAWGAADLVTIAGEKTNLQAYPSHNLGLMVARALVETGKVDLARPILDYSLQLEPGDDAAYALLLKIGQGDLVAKLDALYKLDQFENRPLIWKATVLLQQGKIAEAEEACKAAIVVDPSDGQTGKGDRMRVYSVMAEICDVKKDDKQAAFFRNVVKAIRLSEDADDYEDVGLITHAVKMYEEALGFFSDAYCIQSRLARQLAELGRMEEAAVHYRKAFELMPVSFGRMESHCFGCERAFDGKTAASIARQVFTEMLAKDPNKPQLYYLRGYLESEEEEFPEAVADYEQAVKLDPDYINAWKKIIGIGELYQLKPALGDEAFFNVLRLDPGRRHYLPSSRKIRQLARLWTLLEASLLVMPPAPAALYPLKASASQIAEADAKVAEAMAKIGMADSWKQALEEWTHHLPGHGRENESTRQLVLQNDVIREALTNLW